MVTVVVVLGPLHGNDIIHFQIQIQLVHPGRDHDLNIALRGVLPLLRQCEFEVFFGLLVDFKERMLGWR